MKKYKITLFGVKETTKIIADYLHSLGIKIDLLISIDESVVVKNHIADYLNLENTAKSIKADYYCVQDYSLKQLDNRFFEDNEFDIGIVYGWQRLIPATILRKFKTGVFGFHASPDFLPKGRGRSPLNWAIIQGQSILYNHFFKYAEDADAGDIYSITKFTITPYDTILTILYKSLLTAKKEIIRLLKDVESQTLTLVPQRGESSFFPKRTPEDGLIYFHTDSTKNIVNLIRGVTAPFPGAFCYTEQGKKIIVWEAWPFDALIDFSEYQPGEVIDNIYNMPIIKTIDGCIILRQYEGSFLKPKDKLTHLCQKNNS